MIAFIAIYVITFSMFDSLYLDAESGDYIEFSDAIELKAGVLSYRVNDNQATILGVIENNTDYQWKETSVEAEFYLGAEFVKECKEEILTKIQSNGKENFEFTCKSCEDEFPDFDRIEIKINDSWKVD